MCNLGLLDLALQLDNASENDPDIQAKQQIALLAAANRTLALAIGRGGVALGSATLLPGEDLGTPALVLSGYMRMGEGRRGLITLDQKTASKAEGEGQCKYSIGAGSLASCSVLCLSMCRCTSNLCVCMYMFVTMFIKGR